MKESDERAWGMSPHVRRDVMQKGWKMFLFALFVLVMPLAVLAQVTSPTPVVPSGPPAEVITWLGGGVLLLAAFVTPVLTAFTKSVFSKLPSWASPVIVFLWATAETTLAQVTFPVGKYTWAMVLGLSFVSVVVRQVKIAIWPAK
jgi:hypothetical protein